MTFKKVIILANACAAGMNLSQFLQGSNWPGNIILFGVCAVIAVWSIGEL